MADFPQIQDHVIHHSANVAAIMFPVTSLWLHAPIFFSVFTGALGSVWYAILIGERVNAWLERRKK